MDSNYGNLNLNPGAPG